MTPDHADTSTSSFEVDDFTRNVYGVLGIPVDVVDMDTVLRGVENAALRATPFLISTANLNFLIAGRSDAELRESLLLSDLCTADGMPVVWMARLLGIPITDRVAGSDMFERLKSAPTSDRHLKVFLFGGPEGAAAAACKRINSKAGPVACAGSFYPGFGTIEEMSSDSVIAAVNASNADFLIAALGAKKGQAWLLRNHHHVTIPIRAHLGAVINFEAGTVKRAPARLQRWGLEWLWRIKEEPQLWQRYFRDSIALFRLFVTSVIPLLILGWWHKPGGGQNDQRLLIERTENHKSVTLSINGDAVAKNVERAVPHFREAAATAKATIINLAGTRSIDARFFGLLLMLYKQLKKRNLRLEFTGVPPKIARLFRLNGFEFLLSN